MINKSILLTALALTPNLSAIPLNINNTAYLQENNEQAEDYEACTFMYVGKNVSETGRAYVARSADAGPKGINVNAQIFNHNELANKTIEGFNGFKWTMPSTTYRYIATPKNPNLKANLHWEVSAINENGVCCSCTLTCSTNSVAQAADPFVKTGIGEDNLTQVIGATATSARNGVETIAKIIKEQGNQDANAIMIMDKDEAWYMELYTGHQFVAIKMPDDKCCTIGNEFMLDTLKDYGTDVITSDDLFSLPKEKGFAKYVGEEADENMHMFNTYGGEDTAGTFIDGCHMRTWRGLSMFTDDAPVYETSTKYPAFFTPSRKLGLKDVISFMRDRFESITDNPEDPNYTYFKKLLDEGSLRYIGVNFAYQVHVLSINPNLPTSSCCEEWFTMSNANYTPFVPITSGITQMDEYYTRVSPNFGWDEKSAACIYRRLNSLADIDRTNYGKPIQSLIEYQENIWQTQFDDLIDQIKTLSLSTQNNVLTNYTCKLQKDALTLSNMLFDDLTWHIINTTKGKEFKPLINLKDFSSYYGWNYSFKDNIATLTNNSDTVKVDYSYTSKPSSGWITGKVTKNGEDPIDVTLKYKDNTAYIDFATAKTYLSENYQISSINWKDYNTDNNKWYIYFGVVMVVAAVTVPFIIEAISKKKKRNHI